MEALAALPVILFDPVNLGLVVFGVIVGLIVGAIPGLTATLAIALLLPFAFGKPAIPSFAFMIGIYSGGIYGGGITATLIGTPGTPGAMVTVFDGYEMTKKGQAGQALGMGTVASVIGGIIGTMVCATVATPIAKFSLRFSEPEYFMLALFGLTIVLAISEKSMLKGLISAAIGCLVMVVGIDPIQYYPRFTFGIQDLQIGLPMLPAFIGLFALSRLFAALETKPPEIQRSKADIRSVIPSWKVMKNYAWLLIKSSFLGTFVGALPGAGANIASVLAYSEAKRTSKHPEKFGTGIIEGIASAESANNAVTGGALIPMLTLGIPGDAITAVLLGALMIQGLAPGPLLFRDHPDLVYAVIASMLVSYLALLVVGLPLLRVWAKVIDVKEEILLPLITVFALMGGYVLESSYYYMYVALGFGFLGWFLEKFGFPIAPVGLTIILGPLAESSFRKALVSFQGDLTVFLTRPISLVLFILTTVSVAYSLLREFRKSR